MGKKWIVGLMILAALWAMTGCGKQEMIRCEYTNEAARRAASIFATAFLPIMQGMKMIWRPWK